MKCYKKSSNIANDAFEVNGSYYSLLPCTSEEELIIQHTLSEYWYIKESIESSETDGGWSGTRSTSRVYRDIVPENVVLDNETVLGFRICDPHCDREVSQLFFSIEKENVWYRINKTTTYSFDHGDGDGVSSYYYALYKKDTRIVDFINTYCFFVERNFVLPHETNKDLRYYQEISYDPTSYVDNNNQVHVSLFSHSITSASEGRKYRCFGKDYTLIKKIDRSPLYATYK